MLCYPSSYPTLANISYPVCFNLVIAAIGMFWDNAWFLSKVVIKKIRDRTTQVVIVYKPRDTLTHTRSGSCQ